MPASVTVLVTRWVILPVSSCSFSVSTLVVTVLPSAPVVLLVSVMLSMTFWELVEAPELGLLAASCCFFRSACRALRSAAIWLAKFQAGLLM